MKLLFSRIRLRTLELLGADMLSHEFLMYSVIYCMFTFANTLASTFVNIFLFKENGDFSMVFRYNIIYYIAESIGFLIAMYVVRRRSLLATLRISLVASCLSYLILLLLHNKTAQAYPLIAILIALSNAFFWECNMPYFMRSTTMAERQTATSFQGLTSNAIVIVAPMLAGTITSAIAGIGGYVAVFALAGTVFFLAAWISGKLTIRTEKSKPRMAETLRYSAASRPMRAMLAGEFFRGAREGIYFFYINVLFFFYTSNELFLGICITAKNIATMLIFWVLKQKINEHNRVRFYNAAYIWLSLFHIAVAAVVCFHIDGTMLVILTLVDAIVSLVTSSAGSFAAFEYIEEASIRCGEYSYESVTIRCMAQETGRVIPMILLACFPVGPEKGGIPLLLTALMAIPAWMCFQLGYRRLAAQQKEERL